MGHPGGIVSYVAAPGSGHEPGVQVSSPAHQAPGLVGSLLLLLPLLLDLSSHFHTTDSNHQLPSHFSYLFDMCSDIFSSVCPVPIDHCPLLKSTLVALLVRMTLSEIVADWNSDRQLPLAGPIKFSLFISFSISFSLEFQIEIQKQPF